MRYVLDYLHNYYYLLIITVFMFVLIGLKREKKHEFEKTLLFVFFLLLAISVGEFYDDYCSGDPSLIFERYCVATIKYALRPIMIMYVIFIIDNEYKKKPLIWLPAACNAAVYLLSPISHWGFYFSEDNYFRRGPLGYCVLVTSIFYGALTIIIIFRSFQQKRWSEGTLYVLSVLATAGAGIVDMCFWDLINIPIYLTTMAISMVMYYLFLLLQHNRERELENQLELQKKQMELTISQIKPHFLYNTLASIRVLTKKDPKLAADTIDNFVGYLRHNMSAIGQDSPIPLEQELLHVQNYADIEMLRFPNVAVLFDIEDEGFLIPALTIQPLVENAIKHGVRSKEEGWVQIHTYKEGRNHVIRVTDNGVGFDTENVEYHVGIANVRRRLELMVNGSMETISTIGEGTEVILVIPEKNREDVTGLQEN